MTDLNIKLKIEDEGADDAVSSLDGLESEIEQLASSFNRFNREAARAAAPVESAQNELTAFTNAANRNGIALNRLGTSSRGASDDLSSLMRGADGTIDVLSHLGTTGEGTGVELTGLANAAGEGGSAMGELGALAGEGGSALGALAGPVGVAAAAIGVTLAGAVSAAAAAYTVLTEVVIPFSEELERQMGILNSTEGSVDEASEAIGGLVSNIDLVVARNRLLQAGIRLTDHDFAALSEKAVIFARSAGEDVVGTMQRLGQALRTTSAEGLQEFGIQLDSSQEKSEQFQSALEQLRVEAAATEVGADTLGGAFQRLDVFVENAKTEFIRMFDASEGLREEFDLLWEAIVELARGFDIDLRSPMDAVRRVFLATIATIEEFVRRIRVMTQAWAAFNTALRDGALGDAAAALARGTSAAVDYSDAVSNIAANVARLNENVAQANENQLESPDTSSVRTPPTARSGGSASRERTAAVIEAERARAVQLGQIERTIELTQELIRLEESRGRVIEDNTDLMDALTPPSDIDTFLEQQARLRSQAQTDFNAEVTRGQTSLALRQDILTSIQDENVATAERARAEQQIVGLLGEQGDAWAVLIQEFGRSIGGHDQIIDRFITQRDIQEAMTDAFARHVSLQEVYNDLLIVARQRAQAWSHMQQQVNSRIDEFRPLVQQSIDLIIAGGENMEEGLVRILEMWLKNFAIQEGFESAKEFVMAIAAAARQDYVAAGQHAAAGAGHLALAVAAGGSAAGIAAASGGGSSASDQPQQQEDTGASRGPQEVTIVIQGQPLLDQKAIGDAVRRALNASNLRS